MFSVPRLTFRPRQRLAHANQFARVYGAKISRTSGPLTVHAALNGELICRLGLSIGKRAGGAVQRNAFKRRIREAFRHIQHDLPAGEGQGLDLVVSVRKHEPLSAGAYQEGLLSLILKVAADCQKRRGGA